jgi:hypothetical protein
MKPEILLKEVLNTITLSYAHDDPYIEVYVPRQDIDLACVYMLRVSDLDFAPFVIYSCLVIERI